MASKQELIHRLHRDNNKSIPSPVNVARGPLVQILSDPVQLFRRTESVEREFLHIILDEAILGVNREDIVNESFVPWSKCAATPATTMTHLTRNYLEEYRKDYNIDKLTND
jgi:hypothetical protein